MFQEYITKDTHSMHTNTYACLINYFFRKFENIYIEVNNDMD